MTPRGIVAVTGGTGFIGQRLLPRLAAAGWTVRALTRRPQCDKSSVEWISGDLADTAALERLLTGADAFVHMAGAIKALNRGAFHDANAGGTRACWRLAQSCPRVVHLSSLAAREPQLSHYGASKRAAEAVFAGAPNVAILRPCAVYGPGDRETLALFRAVRRRIAPRLRGAGRVGLIHVDDLAAAIVHVLDSGEGLGRTLQLDDGAPGGYAHRDINDAIARALGVRPAQPGVPRALLTAVAAANQAIAAITRRPAMLTPAKVRELTHHDWTAQPPRLQDVTAWRPAIAAEAGLAATARWYVENGWLRGGPPAAGSKFI